MTTNDFLFENSLGHCEVASGSMHVQFVCVIFFGSVYISEWGS